MKKALTIALTVFMFGLVAVAPCLAADEVVQEAETQGMATSVKLIAAALAVGICAIGTGLAQSRIGAAGMGTIVEKPELIGSVVICLAIPETIVILGFVVAAIIIFL